MKKIAMCVLLYVSLANILNLTSPTGSSQIINVVTAIISAALFMVLLIKPDKN